MDLDTVSIPFVSTLSNRRGGEKVNYVAKPQGISH